MRIGIIDYQMGNPVSVSNMLRKLGHKADITADPEKLLAMDKLILPGVGHFKEGMTRLKVYNLDSVITQFVEEGKYLLGICLGMQLLTQSSEEGYVDGLNLIPLRTKKFDLSEGFRVPHMGWSSVKKKLDHRLFNQLDIENTRYYFVHSYCVENDGSVNVIATTHYEKDFASIIGKNNVIGTQFHPEKSHKYGMNLLRSFCDL